MSQRKLKIVCGNGRRKAARGGATASVALKRLVGFSANRDRGHILKTEFILLSTSGRRNCAAGILHALLKFEQLHVLARDVFYGRRGRINARETW